MKDLIAKLKSDACLAMGGIWLHIDAREARIAELEAENTNLRYELNAALSGGTVSCPTPQVVAEPEWIEGRNDDPAEAAFWRFDARKKGYSRWKGAPQSERDAFKAEYRAASTALQAPVREVPEGMPVTQEPKYGIRDNRLFNRASGEFIPEDEPVFIFRARDRHAIYAIAQYKGHYLQDESHKEAVGNRIKDFRAFMEANPKRMKEPDTALPAAPVQEPKP